MLESTTRYVAGHWRGDHSLARSVLLNGLLIYLVLVVALVSLGQLITAQWFLFLGLAVFLVCGIWAAVGIVRCALRITISADATLFNRLLAVASIVAVSAAIVLAVFDLRSLVFERP